MANEDQTTVQPPTNGTQSQPQPVAQPQPVPPPQVIDVEAIKRAAREDADREAMARVEKARAEEKQKLYPEMERLKSRLKETEAQLQGKLSPDEKVQAQLADVTRKLEETTAQMTAQQQETQKQLAQYQANLRAAQLQSYLERRVREEKEQGHEFMLDLVVGATEQEIDASIEFAKQEFKRLEQFYRDRIMKEMMAQQAATPPVPVAHGVQRVTVPTPADFPVAPNAQTPPQVAPGSAGFTEVVAEVTTPEAVRSGAYGAKRQQILAHLRQQNVAPMQGTPFANMPRQYQQTVQPPPNGGVIQPQGLPTPPVVPPQMQMQASNPQNLPPQYMHQQQPGGIQPATPQPPQAMQVAQQPIVTPTGLSADQLAQARTMAQQAARQHLSNPQGVQAPTRGPAPSAPPGYGNAPNPNANFDGGHPMVRNG